jgi:hypothetical protein
MNDLATRLDAAFAGNSTPDWPWFEDIVTYDNGRMPQALVIAGYDLGDDRLIMRGLRVLQWLLDVQTSERGYLSVIGNDGWFRRGGEKARFDQQPIEAAALVGACKAAYRATGDTRWLAEMRRCFDWFLGRNDLDRPLVNFKTRGCFDGLQPDRVNANQGAESLLSWLHSLLIMHEMQTGEAPDLG